jgi:hypothetical protein
MIQYDIEVITTGGVLPALDDSNFFHSSQLFQLVAHTPRQKPYMVVARRRDDGTLAAHMLGVVRQRGSWFPPYLYRHCRLLGEGVYSPSVTSVSGARSELFRLMLQTLRRRLGNRVLYIEVSNVSQKMFAYREFRQEAFFPVRWMSIHNSLHSHAPEERIGERMMQRIQQAYERGVVTDEVKHEADFTAFLKLLRRHNILKPKRYIPHDDFFRDIHQKGYGRLYVTKLRNHVIGCAVVVNSGDNAYLWYSAFRRKSYAFVHPDLLTIWHVLKDAHEKGSQHVFFLDVGLPFKQNSFRDFILSFGGKPVSTYRWFRFSIRWMNALGSWLFRD